METATTNAESMAAARKRLAHLRKRSAALEAETRDAADREAGLLVAFEEAKRRHVEGEASDADVVAAEEAIETHRRRGRHLEEAASKVRFETREIEDVINGEEQLAERRRQTAAAAGMLKQGEELIDAFIEGLVNIRGPLLARAELSERLGAELPMAPAIEPVLLDDLGRRLRDRLGRESNAPHFECVQAVRRALAGFDGAFSEHTERTFHVRQR
jgi:hypothetical protein